LSELDILWPHPPPSLTLTLNCPSSTCCGRTGKFLHDGDGQPATPDTADFAPMRHLLSSGLRDTCMVAAADLLVEHLLVAEMTDRCFPVWPYIVALRQN